MKLVIHKDTNSLVPSARIRLLFDIICDEEADPDLRGTVNLVFTSSQKIRVLNRKYRDLDRATDVLSFNIDQPDSDDDIFGEIYISSQRAAAQAKAYGGALDEEYERLFCHGLLHLLGHDHTRPRETDRMQAAERAILSRPKGTR